MNEIVEKLIAGQYTVAQALYMARPASKGNVRAFIDNEIDGYKDLQSLPAYRVLNCPMIFTYQTPLGYVFRDVELDASPLSKAVGYNLNNVPFLENIDSVINNIASLSGNYGTKPFNDQMLAMISPYAVPAHAGSKIISGGFKVYVQQLQSILDNVKRDLIKLLQDETSEPNVQKQLPSKANEPKTVFVSYAWDSDDYNTKVRSFVDFLRKHGYDARMDTLETQKETSISLTRMMHKGIYDSDKVVVILSEKYKKKADALEGGVGEEIKIIQEDISRTSNKYILVSFETLTTTIISNVLPASLVNREVLDLKRDQDETGFNVLFSKLSSEAIILFSDVAEKEPEVKKQDIPDFKL